MKKLLLLLTVSLFSLTSLIAQVDYQAIVQGYDDLDNFEGMDLSAQFTMVSQKPGEDKSVIKIQLFLREVKDQFLYVVLKPEVNKGEGFLKSGDNAWAYDPISRKFNHTSLKEHIGDSEAKNDDVGGTKLVEDYNIIDAEEGSLGKIEAYIITLEAKTNEVAIPKRKMWFRKDNNLVLMDEEYSLSGRKVRTTLFTKWTTVAGKYIATRRLIKDELKTGEKSQISVDNISNKTIPDDVFTKAYLEKINTK